MKLKRLLDNLILIPLLCGYMPYPTPVPTPSQGMFNLPQSFQSGGLTVVGGGTNSIPAGPGLGNYGAGDVYQPQGNVLGDATVKTNNIPTAPSAPTAPPMPTGPSSSEIDSLYNPSMNYLNQTEGVVRSDYQNVLSQADRDFQVLQNQLTSGKQANIATIGETQVKAGQVKDDALSAARRLYDELRRGYQQRFGGTTSAGQAASEISSVEQQRQQGQTQRSYGDTIRETEQQKVKVEKDYQDGLFQLEQNKQSAISQAYSDFQNKLLQISNNRSQIESAKANAKLDALQQLRNQVFEIQTESYQYQRALDQQKQQATSTLQNYLNQFGEQAQLSQQTLSAAGFNTNPSSGLQANMQPTAGQSASMVGQITPTKKDELSLRY